MAVLISEIQKTLEILESNFLPKPEFSDLRVNIFVDPKHHRYPGYRWFAGRNSFVIEKLGGTVLWIMSLYLCARFTT